MNNISIRKKIMAANLRHYQVAHEMGICPSYLSMMLRNELSGADKKSVIDAIDRLIEKQKEGDRQ